VSNEIEICFSIAPYNVGLLIVAKKLYIRRKIYMSIVLRLELSKWHAHEEKVGKIK
jgi:hypothetical protein